MTYSELYDRVCDLIYVEEMRVAVAEDKIFSGNYNGGEMREELEDIKNELRKIERGEVADLMRKAWDDHHAYNDIELAVEQIKLCISTAQDCNTLFSIMKEGI